MECAVTPLDRNRILTNFAVWSPDSRRLVADVRSDAAGSIFDGTHIETIDIKTGEIERLYESQHGACCGVATWHPHEEKVVFILGPEHPSEAWNYAPMRRQGVVVEPGKRVQNLDARDLLPPYTPGALRGGTHLHVWSPDGTKVAFTYEDQVVNFFTQEEKGEEINLRTIGATWLHRPVTVPRHHERNHDGIGFSVVLVDCVANPEPGSDQVERACEEGWLGSHSLAFQGRVQTASREKISEVFIVKLPEDPTVSAAEGSITGTTTQRPRAPLTTEWKRLTYTESHAFPGLSGPRHWLRGSPDGKQIGFLKKDDFGVVQFWIISAHGGTPESVTTGPHSVASAFSWSPDGREVAFIRQGEVDVVDIRTGTTTRLTRNEQSPARPEACVFSPDGLKIAYLRRGREEINQIFVVTRS